MEIAVVGLGRMGLNMSLRMLRGGHSVFVNNLTPEPVEEAESHEAVAINDLKTIADVMAAPRAVWLMLPAGAITRGVIDELLEVLEPGDVIVDGANSNYRDSLANAEAARQHGVRFVDCGVSGGVWGLEFGYSLMVGGDDDAVAHVEPILRTLAPSEDVGWGHVGPSGAGHFTKMVHNGIEYGMMQAYAEGFALLEAKRSFGAAEDVQLDLAKIADTWRTGSVVRSWLLDLAAEAIRQEPGLDSIAPYVADSGTGRWTVEEALDLRVPLPVITASLFARFASQDERKYGERLLAALRGQFGGHPMKEELPDPTDLER
ncbi:decarboxylating 6-phosphogluconate dehydrogenase [soil metagenome]